MFSNDVKIDEMTATALNVCQRTNLGLSDNTKNSEWTNIPRAFNFSLEHVKSNWKRCVWHSCEFRAVRSKTLHSRSQVALHRNALPARERHKEIHLVSHRTMEKWIFRVDSSIFRVSFGIEIFCISGIILGNTEKYSKDAELPYI